MLINECNPRVTPDGRLRFSIPGFARSLGEITSWEEGFETRLVRNGKASPSQLWALTLLPRRPARALPADAQAFFDRIPATLRQQVKQFAFGQALMLRTLARSREAADLIDGHPVIFWLMIAAVYDARIDPAELERLSRARRVDILRRIVDSRCAASPSLLRKVDIDEGTLGDAHDVIRALCDRDVVRVAAHQRRLSVGLLRAMTAFPALLEPAVVKILADDAHGGSIDSLSDAEDFASHVADIRRMALCLGIERPEQAMSRCRSVADLRRLHDRWVERVNRRRATGRQRASTSEVLARLGPLRCPPRGNAALDPDTGEAWLFPAPPLPDSRDILAIRDYDDLRREGFQQRNCVASYAAAIVGGSSYIYRVLRPQRATLELRWMPSGWSLGQLKLAGNAAAAPELLGHVQSWFERCRDAGEVGKGSGD